MCVGFARPLPRRNRERQIVHPDARIRTRDDRNQPRHRARDLLVAAQAHRT